MNSLADTRHILDLELFLFWLFIVTRCERTIHESGRRQRDWTGLGDVRKCIDAYATHTHTKNKPQIICKKGWNNGNEYSCYVSNISVIQINCVDQTQNPETHQKPRLLTICRSSISHSIAISIWLEICMYILYFWQSWSNCHAHYSLRKFHEIWPKIYRRLCVVVNIDDVRWPCLQHHTCRSFLVFSRPLPWPQPGPMAVVSRDHHHNRRADWTEDEAVKQIAPHIFKQSERKHIHISSSSSFVGLCVCTALCKYFAIVDNQSSVV